MHDIELKVITNRLYALREDIVIHDVAVFQNIPFTILIDEFKKSNYSLKDLYFNYSANPALTINDIIDYPGPWDWRKVSSNPGIKLRDVAEHLDFPWVLTDLVNNPSISEDDLKNTPGPWNWGGIDYFMFKNIFAKKDLSLNHAIFLYRIRSKIMKISSRFTHSNRDHFILPLIDRFNLANDDEELWSNILDKITVTYEDVINSDILNDEDLVYITSYYICKNKGITLDDYLYKTSRMKFIWDLDGLSCNPNITIDDVNNNPEIEWNYYSLSENPNFYPEEHPDFPWKYNTLSKNPNITFDYVIKNLDKIWDWNDLSSNPALFNIKITDPDLLACAREFFAARRIQRQWHQAINNPERKLCRRRLQREFCELNNSA